MAPAGAAPGNDGTPILTEQNTPRIISNIVVEKEFVRMRA